MSRVKASGRNKKKLVEVLDVNAKHECKACGRDESSH